MNRPPTLAQLTALSAEVGRLLIMRGLTVAAAESCTGGLLLSTLTDIAGSSVYVLGGVVSYSDQAKMELLGVPQELLAQHGAVSAEAAAAMAQGARRLLRSDLAVAVTGIAGPGGGTPAKPVGLVFLHLSGVDAAVVASRIEASRHHVWPYDRPGNKRASVAAGLAMLRQHLAGL